MGMYANFLACDDAQLAELKSRSSDELLEAVEQLEEKAALTFSLDKMWDGLHFILTDVSASDPIEDNEYSIAIVGEESFFEEGDFIAYTPTSMLSGIVSALTAIHIDKIGSDQDFIGLNEQGIYPSIWSVEDEQADIRTELRSCFQGLCQFYEKAHATNLNVIVSIY